MDSNGKKWYKVLDNRKMLPEGRVQTVTAGHQGICLTHYKGKFSALDNACPHQGGPLGEGSIENGMLRCPWHGWEFDIKMEQSWFDPSRVRVRPYPVSVEGDVSGYVQGSFSAETYPTSIEAAYIVVDLSRSSGIQGIDSF